MSFVDMTWTGRMTPNVTPSVPTWDAPKFDAVGAMQAAQRYLANKQAMDQAAQEGPVNLALKQAQLENYKYEAGRRGTQEQLDELRLKQAQQGVADDADLHDLRMQATKADLQAKIDAGQITNDQIKRANAVADALKYVYTFPDGSPEQTAAWGEQMDALGQSGIMKPEEADAWKKHGPDRSLARTAIDTNDFLKDALARSQTGQTSYASLSTDEKLKIEDAIRKRATAGLSTYDTQDQAAMQKRMDDARQQVYQELGITGLPAGDAASGSIKADTADYAGKIRDATDSPEGALRGDKTDATGAEYPKPAGQKKRLTNKADKTAQPAEGDGKSSDTAVAYPGDPNDHAAAIKWWNALPTGTWVINPSTGQPVPKAQNLE